MRGCAAVGAWGSTHEERLATYPCDGLIEEPDRALFRAVDIAAPSGRVYRWLCQLRIAPYSYDWIDNLGRRSPRHLTPGLDRLEVGQRFMTIFRLVSFVEGRSITLDSRTAAFGHVVVTYLVAAVATERSRLVVKLVLETPRGPYGAVARAVLPAGDLVMMRKQLLSLKSLSERPGS